MSEDSNNDDENGGLSTGSIIAIVIAVVIVAIIFLVVLSVILSAVIGTFVLGLGSQVEQNQTVTQATGRVGLEYYEKADGVTIEITRVEYADAVELYDSEGRVLYGFRRVGDSYNVTRGGVYYVYAAKGQESWVVERFEVRNSSDGYVVNKLPNQGY